MDRDRKKNRIPYGLSILMWPALVRAPWLINGFAGSDEERQHADESRRRKYDDR